MYNNNGNNDNSFSFSNNNHYNQNSYQFNSSDFVPLSQFNGNLATDTSNNIRKGSYNITGYEPLSLIPIYPKEIIIEESDQQNQAEQSGKPKKRLANTTEGLVTYYEEKFHSEVLGSIDTEDINKELEASQMLMLGEYPKEYIKKYLTSTGRMKKKVKVEKIKRRKTAGPEAFLKGLFETEKEKENKWDKFKKEFVSFVMRKWVDFLGPYIPDKLFKTLWDFMMLIFTYYTLIMVPVEVSFDIEINSTINSFDTLVTICFIIDMLITFNTAIFVRGLQIKHRKAIAIHYFKFWFWIDIISSFPYEAVFPSESADNYFNLIYSNASYATFFTYFRFFQVVRLVRILKLRKLFNHLENFLDLNNTLTNVFGFVKLSLYVFIVAHWISCYFHFEGFSETSIERVTWLSNYGIVDDPWYNRYLASFYFGIATMQTVGFGDIIPVTSKERIITIIAMMIACGMFGYTMNKINLIVSGLDNTTDHYKRSIISISNYMRQKNVRKDLQVKIKKFLEYSLNEESAIYMENNSIYSLLSDTLRFELMLQVQGRSIKKCRTFDKFSTGFLHVILDIVSEKLYAPDDIICLEISNDLGMYIVNQGRVVIYRYFSNEVIKTKGAVFGEISFFSGQPKIASCKSADFSSIYYIEREAFINRLANNPIDHENFYHIKDKIICYKDYGIINIECYECKKHGHIVNNCPKKKLRFDRDNFYQEILQEQMVFKKEFVRNDRARVLNYDKYERMRDGADYVQRVMHEVFTKSDKLKIQRRLAMKAFQSRKQLLVRQNSIVSENEINNPVVVNDLSDMDNSYLNMTTTNLDKSQSNINTALAQLEATDNENEEVLRWVEPAPEEQEESDQEVNKKVKKKDPYSLRGTPKKEFDEFDRVMEFKYYFPHNNLSAVTKK